MAHSSITLSMQSANNLPLARVTCRWDGTGPVTIDSQFGNMAEASGMGDTGEIQAALSEAITAAGQELARHLTDGRR